MAQPLDRYSHAGDDLDAREASDSPQMPLIRAFSSIGLCIAAGAHDLKEWLLDT